MPVKKREKLRLPSPGSASTMSDYDINTDDELPYDDDMLGSELDDSDQDMEADENEELDSEGDDGEEIDSDGDDDEDQDDLVDRFDELPDEIDNAELRRVRKGKKKETEADYERSGRIRWAEDSGDEDEADEVEVGRLPIKLPTGEVQQVEGTTKIALPATKKRKAPMAVKKEDDDIEEEEFDEDDQEGAAARMAAQKGKFGRMGVAEIAAQGGWKNAQKLEAAKEQIAALGAEILAGGELYDTVSHTRPVLYKLQGRERRSFG